jgi:hypothetical protein
MRVGKVITDGALFEPDQEYSSRFVVWVPKSKTPSRWTVARLSVVLYLAPADRLHFSEFPLSGPRYYSKTDDPNSLREIDTVWGIREASGLQSFVHGQRFVVSRWIFGEEHTLSPEYPVLAVIIARRYSLFSPYLYDEGRANNVIVSDAEKLYGLTRTTWVSELAIQQSK